VPAPAGFLRRFGGACRKFQFRGFAYAWVIVLLVLLPLQERHPDSPMAIYEKASKLFLHGWLADSQQEAERGVIEFQVSDPEWAEKFQLLEAEAMVWRGLYGEALHLLAGFPTPRDRDGLIRKLAIEAVALTHQQQPTTADQRLTEAEIQCEGAAYPACGDVLRARGILAAETGQLAEARQFFLESLSFSRVHHDRLLEATALLSLSWVALQVGHFDEALDWSDSANRAALDIGAGDLAQVASGNLGWAYLQLGDDERALEQFLDAEKRAAQLGDIRYQLKWTSTAGYVYRDSGDLDRATQSYQQALSLAKLLDSKEDIVNALEDLAQVSVDSGELSEASAYIDQVTPMELVDGNRLSANVQLTEGMMAAARRQDQQAESLFRAVRDDSSNPTTTRLGAGQQLARLFAMQGNTHAAEQMLRVTLGDFEAARAQLKSEESTLPFVANATPIYDDYIRLLLDQGRSDEALAVADRSRARTLAQGLDGPAHKISFQPENLQPRKIAQKTGATLLFYWLGEKQSYLWAITPAKIAFFPLPAQADIVARIQRYRKALLDLQDPLQSGNEDGRALYRLLVAPASGLIRPNRPVMILADGALNQLNFETLLVPGLSPQPDGNSGRSPDVHYWIDDATLLSAPSLAMLAAAKPAPNLTRSLLLLGNPVSPSEDFPDLPLFGFEMKSIQSHFSPGNVAVFTGQQATPAAYLSSNPASYAYIHFVSHAVSSRTDPLDSAIILSGNGPGADSFKLYARDIMRRPIDARLVTIAACSASGTRAYAGEGLVGLSWAFLRAGAQSVIGALWEVSDDSSPRLMNTLYQGLEDGQTPAVALRVAKLTMLHSESRFRVPFFWAPFQIYTRQ
jgi:CHAT domain-containing protein/Tfp pilus assembly protein PilF